MDSTFHRLPPWFFVISSLPVLYLYPLFITRRCMHECQFILEAFACSNTDSERKPSKFRFSALSYVLTIPPFSSCPHRLSLASPPLASSTSCMHCLHHACRPHLLHAFRSATQCLRPLGRDYMTWRVEDGLVLHETTV